MSAPSHLHSEETAANALGGLLREAAQSPVSPKADPELDRLLRKVSSSSEEPHWAWRSWLLAAVAVAAIGLVLGFEWHRRAVMPLTFSTNGVPGHEHVAIAAASGRAVDLEFSDGSVFDVQPAAKLRVESSSPTGARVTLVEGKTTAHIVHRPKANWSVAAGPFEVQVTGTRFSASWDAKNERLSVELYEGSVQVVGSGFVQPISVRAGQRLQAGRGASDWLLTSLDGPAIGFADTQAPASAAPAIASEEPRSADSSMVPAGSVPNNAVPTPTLDWPERLGHADFEGIVREANEFGIERCLSACAPSDLRILADSARYLGRHALAERSLLALRRRSPSDAASAAFLLGRLEELRDVGKALSWYDKSLDEAPTGAYAAEAAAGKMRMLLRTGGPRAAAPAARQYLELSPRGVHAGRAREVLSQAH